MVWHQGEFSKLRPGATAWATSSVVPIASFALQLCGLDSMQYDGLFLRHWSEYLQSRCQHESDYEAAAVHVHIFWHLVLGCFQWYLLPEWPNCWEGRNWPASLEVSVWLRKNFSGRLGNLPVDTSGLCCHDRMHSLHELGLRMLLGVSLRNGKCFRIYHAYIIYIYYIYIYIIYIGYTPHYILIPSLIVYQSLCINVLFSIFMYISHISHIYIHTSYYTLQIVSEQVITMWPINTMKDVCIYIYMYSVCVCVCVSKFRSAVASLVTRLRTGITLY